MPAGFREIVADASVIVRGRITDVRAVAVAGAGIDSVATVAVESVLKGEAAAFVNVRVPGGEIGRTRFVVVGSPTFKPDQRAVFFLKRGADRSEPVAVPKIDVLVDELEEFAQAVRGTGRPEMDGDRAMASLAVIRAGIKSAREGRRSSSRRRSNRRPVRPPAISRRRPPPTAASSSTAMGARAAPPRSTSSCPRATAEPQP